MPRVIAEVHRKDDRVRVRLGDSEEVLSLRVVKELIGALEQCVDDVMHHSSSTTTFKPVYIDE